MHLPMVNTNCTISSEHYHGKCAMTVVHLYRCNTCSFSKDPMHQPFPSDEDIIPQPFPPDDDQS